MPDTCCLEMIYGLVTGTACQMSGSRGVRPMVVVVREWELEGDR